MKIMPQNFQDMILWGLKKIMTYNDLSHKIRINSYKSANKKEIGLKPSKYYHRGSLINFLRPVLSWSNLTSFVMTCPNYGHPIEINKYISQT